MFQNSKQFSLKSAGVSFGLLIVVGVISSAVYEHVVAPSFGLIPDAPIFLYNFLATSVSLLFLVGLVFVALKMLTEGCKHLTKRELRAVLISNIWSWRASKWDVLWIITLAYLATLMFLMLTVMHVVPREKVVGVLSLQEVQTIAAVVITPLMLTMSILALRYVVEFCGEFRRWLKAENDKNKVKTASVMGFFLIAYVVVVVGDLAGWDHMLWFNAA